MADWIKKGERVTVVSFSRVFDFEGEEGWGFSFPCEENGSLLPDKYLGSWMPNYQACMTGVVDGKRVVDKGIERREHSYWEPGSIRCRCGAEVVIDMLMTNTCTACVTCGQIEDFSWHQMTAEQCETWMLGHTNGERGCDRQSEHHEYVRCGRDYNSSGQLLAPREQWGWDTGESLSDILMADEPLR
jgi:hypothetical protein